MTNQPAVQPPAQPTKAITITNYDRIRALSKNARVVDVFAQALGSKTDALMYIVSAMLVVRFSDQLMTCDPASVWDAALQAATLHLSCDPSIGHAYLIPYWNSKKGKLCATFMASWRGLKQMAIRTDQYEDLNSDALYEGEKIVIDRLTGKPRFEGQRTSDVIIGYYNYFKLKNGLEYCLYMTVDEIRAHAEKYSPSYFAKNKAGELTGYWHKDFHSMALKTVTRLNIHRNGVLNPHDTAVITRAEENRGDDTFLDTSFEDINVDEEIIQEKMHPKSEKELLKELGYPDDPTPAPAARATDEKTPTPATPPVPSTSDDPTASKTLSLQLWPAKTIKAVIKAGFAADPTEAAKLLQSVDLNAAKTPPDDVVAYISDLKRQNIAHPAEKPVGATSNGNE